MRSTPYIYNIWSNMIYYKLKTYKCNGKPWYDDANLYDSLVVFTFGHYFFTLTTVHYPLCHAPWSGVVRAFDRRRWVTGARISGTQDNWMTVTSMSHIVQFFRWKLISHHFSVKTSLNWVLPHVRGVCRDVILGSRIKVILISSDRWFDTLVPSS